jgi:hypothetical protein
VEVVDSLFLSLSLAFVGIARATPLEDAVASYNAKAALVDDAWADFQTKQSAAFADVHDWLTGMHSYFYYCGSNNSAADAAWDDQETAWAHLESTTGDPVQPAYETLITALDDAVDALQAAIAADAADPLAKAYSSGPLYFHLPDQPIMFWTDPDPAEPDIDAWMEFDFPHLSVGNNFQTSYVSPTSASLISFLSDLWEWLHFGHWMFKHKDDAYNMQQASQQKLDDICRYCTGSVPLNQVADDCFTQVTLDDWCETESAEECGRLPNGDAACKTLSAKWNCFRWRNVQKCADAAHDYLKSAWWDEISWLQ